MNQNLIATTIAVACGVSIVVGAIKMSEADANMKRTASTKQAGKSKRVPLLVELFTSEGCSSCPSADVALAKLQKDQPYSDALIIPLSEHVDYWNNIGWKDPYSTSKFSDRQGEYSKALHLDGVYTPQIVVDGVHEFVGSDSEATATAVSAAVKSRKAEVTLETLSAHAETLNVEIKNLPEVKRGDIAEVILAITENNLTSSVRRGENAGRKLTHVAVVRDLRSIGKIAPGETFHVSQPLTLKSEWKRRDLSAVVFVQEHKSRRVLGAGIYSLGEK